MKTDDYIKTLEERIGRVEKLIVWLLISSLFALLTLFADFTYTYISKGEQISTRLYKIVKY